MTRTLYTAACVAAGLLLFSAGCAAQGEAENYKELERREDPFETERDPLFGNEAPDAEPATPESPTPPTDPAAPPSPARLTDATATQNVPLSAIEPEFTDEAPVFGLDRENWPTIRFTPADGTTSHHPTYMGRVDLREDGVDLLAIEPTETRLEAALGAPRAQNLSPRNLFDTVAQPVEAGIRSVTIPVVMFFDPPLSETTTPPRE